MHLDAIHELAAAPIATPAELIDTTERMVGVAYRNKTFVSFASEDINCYWMMTAWRKNENIEFDFHDAHDLNTARDTSLPDTIRRRLRERLANTKQVVMLIGDESRAVATRPSRFFYYEVEVIKKLGLPVVFSNLNAARVAQSWRLPRLLTDQYTISVPFRPKIIKYALDDFVATYPAARLTKTTPHHYKASVYTTLGL
jgi:hypothetical protein